MLLLTLIVNLSLESSDEPSSGRYGMIQISEREYVTVGS